MSTQAAGTEYEREWNRFRDLQQAVLLHLMEFGPSKLEALYGHLDQDRSIEVAQALQYLARRMHITVDPDCVVTITASGMSQIRTEK